MASSAHKHQTLPTSYGAPAAPPPTPSTQPNHISTSDAADALSHFLHRLPTTLSLPPRLSPPTTSPPLISLSGKNSNFLNDVLSSFSQLGFFQLTNHLIPSQLAQSAELESLSLFDLPCDQKQKYSKIWPIGFDDDEDKAGESFCFDASCSTESTQLSLSSLQGLASALEKVGLEIVEALSRAVGFEKLPKDGDSRFCSLMWVSEGVAGNKPDFSGRFYPYIIAVQYQIRSQKFSLLADSGWVSVSPQIDSVLVTVGDIAQVWSNGKLKKVRGRPVAVSGDKEDSRSISMTLLVTLPTASTVSVSPLRPLAGGGDGDSVHEEGGDEGSVEKKVFSSFSFEEYAWRVYHERFLFKDPLDRYRI